jgi:hypothetical protein
MKPAFDTGQTRNPTCNQTPPKRQAQRRRAGGNLETAADPLKTCTCFFQNLHLFLSKPALGFPQTCTWFSSNLHLVFPKPALGFPQTCA